ncbi:MAG: hypothetical protein K0B07_05840, partial [DPANN group archaeon]|nr:hypothetical protein [DPANN group archaeon]
MCILNGSLQEFINKQYLKNIQNHSLFGQCQINEENKKYEEEAAGKFLLITNTDLGALDLMKSYKELIVVESA